MNLLREVLNIPVPEILAYSTTSDNPVGAEYMLMERVEGESLSLRWSSLTTDEVRYYDVDRQILRGRFSPSSFPRMEACITRRIY